MNDGAFQKKQGSSDVRVYLKKVEGRNKGNLVQKIREWARGD